METAKPYQTFGDFIQDAARIAHEDGVSLSTLLTRTTEILRMNGEKEVNVLDRIEQVVETVKRYPKCVKCDNDSHPLYLSRCESCWVYGVVCSRSVVAKPKDPGRGLRSTVKSRKVEG